jgi:hypothetical protein
VAFTRCLAAFRTDLPAKGTSDLDRHQTNPLGETPETGQLQGS